MKAHDGPARGRQARQASLIAMLVLSGALYGASAGRAMAQGKVSILELRVRTLRDAGGLEPPAQADEPLNVRLSHALEQRLSEMAGGRFTVQKETQRPGPDTVAFTLEGDLSHAETGKAGGGPYLCVLRLFREGKPRNLIAQWAGVAQTYRDISSNIQRDPRVDPHGLVGELTNRISEKVAEEQGGDQAAAFSAFLQKAMKGEGLKATVVPQTPDGRFPLANERLLSNDGFRVSVSAQDAGTVYLIGLQPLGRPESLLVPENDSGLEVTPERPALAPDAAQKPLSAGIVTVPTDREIVVLVRKHVRLDGEKSPSVHACDRTGKSCPAVGELGDGDTPAVRILDGSPPLESDQRPQTGDPGVARLLAMAAADPPRTWLAYRLKVHVVPRVTALWEKLTAVGKKDPRMLQLSGPAGKRRLALNEKFVLHTKVGANGYLLLLEYGVSGKVRLLSPTNGTLEEAQVKVKQTLRFPRNTANSYSANKPGTERVKAVLLPSRVEAEALRNAVTEGSGSEAGNLSASFGKEPFYTADLSLEVR